MSCATMWHAQLVRRAGCTQKQTKCAACPQPHADMVLPCSIAGFSSRGMSTWEIPFGSGRAKVRAFSCTSEDTV